MLGGSSGLESDSHLKTPKSRVGLESSSRRRRRAPRAAGERFSVPGTMGTAKAFQKGLEAGLRRAAGWSSLGFRFVGKAVERGQDIQAGQRQMWVTSGLPADSLQLA